MRFIHIATEDSLSEAVAQRLVKQWTAFEVDLKLGRKGNAHLRTNLKSYCEIALRNPFFLLTDLDNFTCASLLISEWTEKINVKIPPTLLFRIAVREVETWILADHEAVGVLLNARQLPPNPDNLTDSKRELLKLAEKAPKRIRDDLVVKKGHLASQGIGYNDRLSEFVRTAWCPDRAATRSKSLQRSCVRLRELESTFLAQTKLGKLR